VLTKCSTCHPAAKAHPTTWFAAPQPFPGYVASHRDSGNRSVACAICHKVDGPGSGPNPASPSCFSASFTNADGVPASCHASGPGQAPHAVPFLGHSGVTDATFNDPFPDGCASCHAVTGTSPVTAAPLCTTCHTGGSPLALLNCTSCHTEPPAGTVYPDIAGRHGKHNALAGVTGICATCHSGIDSGTQAHYDRANARPGKDALRVPPGDAAFLAKFNAKSGTASFDSGTLTCSDVSCHGGIPTPGWQTGTIDVDTDSGCRQCHALGTGPGTPENNSPFSGLHAFHLGSTVNAQCTECHDMANGTTGAASHFAFLETPGLEGPAAQTVEPTGNPAFYNATDQTCGTYTCHGQLHVDFSWTGGGPNHSVPFLSTTHTAVTPAGFSGNCTACHAESGTSPLSSAPVCQECHRNTAVSPLTTKDCTSCHARPPAGTAYPNAAGRHAKHDALAGITGICGTCHTTLESGTLAHYDRANGRPGKDALRVPPGDTLFLSTFHANSGSASFDTAAFTCARVSCHGGVTTPRWDTGTIPVNADAGCVLCHILGSGPGNPENNSPNSGRHAKHLTGLGSKGNAVCTECHDMANGTGGASNHFQFLDTPQMEGPAGQTVEPLGTPASYNSADKTCGTFTCHGQQHIAFPWEGSGAAHAVPFLATAHTSATQADFDGFCGACHAVTGTSPLAGAPACQTCHTNAGVSNPLTTKDCTSCHADPPSGAAYANIEGAHGEHVALSSAGTPVACGTCHNGLGSGTQSHYDRAKTRQEPASVAFTATYNAQSGASSFNPALGSLSCSNVSCHGGQTTPNFRTGTIDVNTNAGCLQCHAFGSGQFNSFNSGEHEKHIEDGVQCRECHNMDLATPGAQNHFAFLGTTTMEGPASDTFQSLPAPNTIVYDPGEDTCTGTCHDKEHDPRSWF
jgi:predicted CxxxxCH...CXXCH cytochrome family protein